MTVTANSLFVIEPYWYNGTWVFDDETRNLVKEPFVCGIPEIMDDMLKRAKIKKKDAKPGFTLAFSATEIPNANVHLEHIRAESGGNWYRDATSNKEGWLCPALFKYFPQAPKHLYGTATLSE